MTPRAGWGGRAPALLVVGIVLALGLLTLWMSLSPPYAWTAATWRLAPETVLAPLRSYLFRNAVSNSAWLVLGTTPVTLLLAMGWARLGLPRRGHSLLLAPLFLPGAVVGLLWRPVLEPWLILAQTEIALLCTALVLVWQTTPPVAWLLAHGHRRVAALLPAWYALTEAGLLFTLTRGEPFNAAHTWASWRLTNLWVTQAWGLAASMSLGLAVPALLLAALVPRPSTTPVRVGAARISWAGTVLPVTWLAAPFAPVIAQVITAPTLAGQGLLAVGGASWLLHWALVVGLSAGLGLGVAHGLRGVVGARRAWLGAVALWLFCPVASALFARLLPWSLAPWSLAIALALLVGMSLCGLGADALRSGAAIRRATALAALWLAHAFALELVPGFDPARALPTLGTVMLTGEAAPAVRGAALLLHGGMALVGAWLLGWATRR